VLEAQFRQTVATQPELLGHHFTEAGLTEQAIGYWLKAGLRSRERSANVEAIGHLTKGLELLGTLDESPERDAQELQFLNPLGSAYQAARGYATAEAGPVFHRARELCDRIGQPLQRYTAMWGVWAWQVTRGEFRLSAELAAEALAFAEQVDDPGMIMEALFPSGFTMLYRGDFAGAREQFRRAVIDYDDRDRTKKWAAITGQDSGGAHRVYLALALWYLGYPDQALSVNREAEAMARTLGHPYSLAQIWHHVAWLYQNYRLGTEAVAAAEMASAISAEQGFAFWGATAMMFKAGGIVLQGRPEEALPLLLKGLDAYRTTGSGLAIPYYLSVLGDAYTRAGRFQDARKALDEGLALAAKNDDRFQEAELHRLKGELHLAESNDQAAAEGCFRTAIETARRQQARAWELRATTSLGRLWQRQGRERDARAALAAVYGTYTEGFTTPDLVDAAALLKALA
jgi:tetratricopeptide (TPR) repeat protein